MTKPLEFHDKNNDNAHVDFQKWREQYSDGYFLNYKGPSSLTRSKKIYSTDHDVLRHWAREESIMNLKQCQHCM